MGAAIALLGLMAAALAFAPRKSEPTKFPSTLVPYEPPVRSGVDHWSGEYLEAGVITASKITVGSATITAEGLVTPDDKDSLRRAITDET